MLQKLMFHGAPVLVTGAGVGIGEACCVALAELDARILAVECNKDSLARLATVLGKACEPYLVDVSREEEVLRLHREVSARHSDLKAMLNIVGTNHGACVTELATEDWNRIVTLNLTSMFWMCRSFIQMLKRAPAGGAIVNMSSTLGVIGMPKMAVYAATKGAIMSLTRNLAVDYGRENVRVNAICPGPTTSPRMEAYIASGQTNRATLEAMVPMGRLAECSEIANMAVFLASDAASYMNGASVVIDGGMTIA